MNKYRMSKAGINVSEGVHRFNENQALYEKFLYRFPEDEHYQQMLDAIDAGNVEEAFQAAHALKGVIGNLSLNKMFEDIYPLVEDLRVGKIDNAQELLVPIKEDYGVVIEAIKESMQA